MIPRLAALLATLAATTLTACGGPAVEYGEPLADGAHKVVKLSGGVRLVFSATDKHTLVAQWGDGDSWTAPQTVHRTPDGLNLWGLDDDQVVHGARTAAIGVDMWDPANPDTEAGPMRTALVVCHDFTCEQSRESEGLSSPSIDADGRVVTFGVGSNRLLVWEKGQGFRTPRVTALPKDRAVVLMPDGAIVAVAGTRQGDFCRYALYVADDDLHFTRAARTPGYGGVCGVSGTEPKGADRLVVYAEGVEDDLAFVRQDGKWRADVPAVPAMSFAYTQGKRSLAPFGFGADGREWRMGSPDGVRILAQSRKGRHDEWDEPRLLATAPPGTRCGFGDATSTDLEVHDAFLAVLIRCYRPRTVREETTPADVALVLWRKDGDWQVESLDGGFELEPDARTARILAAGSTSSLLLTATTSTQVRLPLDPRHENVALLPDGQRLARISCGTGSTWRPTLAVAPLTATTWPQGAPVPGLPADYAGRSGPCHTSLGRDTSGAYYFSVGADITSSEGEPRWENGHFVFLDPGAM